MYRRLPAGEIKDLWRLVGPFFKDPTWGFETHLQIVTRLNRSISFAELKNDPTTKGLGVVRKQFQGKSDITYDWPHLYAKIILLNSKAKRKLKPYHED
jgi:hypothetical protein